MVNCVIVAESLCTLYSLSGWHTEERDVALNSSCRHSGNDYGDTEMSYYVSNSALISQHTVLVFTCN